MRVRRGVVVTALVLAFALGAPLSADAVLIPMTVDELAHTAETIVVVQVAGARTHNRGASASRPDIATDYRLQVSRVLKGARPSEFSLTQAHGTVGDITLVVQDLPAFTPGEQAVLFLDEENRVIGGWQGKLAIERGVISTLGIRIDELARRIESGQSLDAATTDDASVDMLSLATSSVLTPAITGVSPLGANAGIGETVTITGRDFGTVAGTVHFQRGDSLDVAEVVEAGVVSWADTRIVVTVPQKAALFVRVTASSGAASSNFAYQTGFSASGRRWLRIPVSYHINENAAGMVGEGAAIQRAISTWSNAGSEFGLAYGGPSIKTGFFLDGENTASFAPLVGGSLAMNSYWMRGTEIIESDIVFNSVDYQWANYGTSRVIDVETVAVHELGHTVGLDDQYKDSPEVMAAYSGTERRMLTQAEINGAIYLYGYEGSTEPPAPDVWSTSHPDSSAWYSLRDVTWGWSMGTSSVPVARYRLISDGAPDTMPTASAASTTGLVELTRGLADGIWYLHIRAETSTGVLGPVSHAMVRVDGTPPVGSMVIEGGQAVVSGAVVSIASAVSDAHAGMDGMRVSSDGGLTWGPWMEYAEDRSVTLPDEDGPVSLHVQYRDRAGNVRTLTTSMTLESSSATAVLERWYGPDRYTTASEIAMRAFSSADTVIIATGEAFPDALSASGLAGAYDAPLLLTRPTSLPAQVSETIADLGASKVIIVGGEGAVSGDVEQALNLLGLSVQRVEGGDRYATAAAVADQIMVKNGAQTGGTVFVVRGDAFADALAVSPLAYSQKMPVLLTQPGSLPASTRGYIDRYDVAQCVIVGGAGAVSDSVAETLGALTTEPVARWFGLDRYSTAAEVASKATDRGWAEWSFVGVSTGVSFPDALGGGVAAGRANGVLLMTQPESLSEPAAAALRSRAATIKDCRVFGGAGAVSDVVYSGVGLTLAN